MMMIDTTTVQPRTPNGKISAAEYDVKFAREALLDLRMNGTRGEILAAQQKLSIAQSTLSHLIRNR
jgi:hypothetical protein